MPIPNFLNPSGNCSTWRERCVRAARVLVASDFDGTLSEIAPHPDVAAPVAGAAEALAELAAKPRVRVALVSGRPLDTLTPLLPVPGCLYLGSHGNEFSGGQWLPRAQVARQATASSEVARLAGIARAKLAEWPGVRIEIKPYSFAFHYREAPQYEAAIRAFSDRLARTEGLLALPSRRAMEMAPKGLLDKGAAVERLARRLGCGLIFYFGDDRADESVFDRQGEHLIGVLVAHEEWGGSAPARADYEVHSPAEVVLALQELARVLSRGEENSARFGA